MLRSSSSLMARAVSTAVHGIRSRSPRRVPAAGGRPAFEVLENRRLMSVDVTTYHYDNARTGANTAETTLTPTNVNAATFGKVASLAVDGQIYAQPLVMSGVAVAGAGDPRHRPRRHRADSVYAFDAHGNNPAQGYLWKTSLLKAGETTIPESRLRHASTSPRRSASPARR